MYTQKVILGGMWGRIWNKKILHKILKFWSILNLAKKVTNAELRDDFQVFAQVMITQSNSEVAVPMNPNVGKAASRIRDFIRMNPQEFYGFEA